MLDNSLEGGVFLICSKHELHKVSGRDRDSNLLSVAFVEGLVNTTTIINENSAVLHEFNTTFSKGGAALSAVIHDCHLGLALGIADSDG